MNCPETSLVAAQTGRDLRVSALRGSNGHTQRLRELGLLEGKLIRIIASDGPIICEVGTCRLALGRPLARCVIIEPSPASP